MDMIKYIMVLVWVLSMIYGFRLHQKSTGNWQYEIVGFLIIPIGLFIIFYEPLKRYTKDVQTQ